MTPLASVPALIRLFRAATLGLAAWSALLGPGLSAATRVRQEVRFPDLPGFHTLRCDFHMHTVFSDGAVWPTIRVEEAWRDGLDAIAITDHNEYQRYKEDVPVNIGRAYPLALATAKDLGLLLIKGCEITRNEPPGHLNALFVQDIAAIDREDSKKAVQSAFAQGAFIFWNHPGWKQPNRQSVWYEMQEEFFRQGWLKGLEVTNGQNYDPIVHGWAKERKLTLLANSDVHDLIAWRTEIDRPAGKMRPMTLVFATARTEAALKEALLARRTIIFSNGQLCGEEPLLRDLVQRCLEVVSPRLTIKGKARATLQVRNTACLPLQVKITAPGSGIKVGTVSDFAPGAITAIELTRDEKAPNGPTTVVLQCTILNALTAPGQPLRLELKVPVDLAP